MKQYTLTPAAGKRMIGKALAAHPDVTAVLRNGRLVIIAAPSVWP